MAEFQSLRTQIMANAKIMLRPLGSPRSNSQPSALPSADSSATLTPTASGTNPAGDLEIVVFGEGKEFTAAVMIGVVPAIEGGVGGSPEAALRRLLMATCELLHDFMPKLGSHQRNIHGGGVFDEDLISQDLKKAAAKFN